MAMIATTQMQGCNKWKKRFTQKFSKKINTENIERKHNENLNLTLTSNDFARIYRNMKTLNYDNKLKFFQFTINRNTIKTNYIVNKFKPEVNPECSFCHNADEKLNHLFWECPQTSNFIFRCTQFLYASYDGANDIISKMNKQNFIFGIPTEGFNDINNYLFMLMKKFIWNKRCFNKIPTLADFKKFLKTEVTHQINATLSPHADLRMKILKNEEIKTFIDNL